MPGPYRRTRVPGDAAFSSVEPLAKRPRIVCSTCADSDGSSREKDQGHARSGTYARYSLRQPTTPSAANCLDEVEAWIEQREQAARSSSARSSIGPDVRQTQDAPRPGAHCQARRSLLTFPRSATPYPPNRSRYCSGPSAIASTSCSFTSEAFFTLNPRFTIASSGISSGSAPPFNIAGRRR